MRKNIEENIQSRIQLSVICSIVGAMLLLLRLFVLQIHYQQKYKMLSDKNRIRVKSIQPNRGRIFSDKGDILADNISIYRLSIKYNTIQKRLATLDFLTTIIDIDEHDRKRIRKEIMHKYKTIVIKDKLTWDEFVTVSLHLTIMSDISLERLSSRVYTNNIEYAHILGYLHNNTDTGKKSGACGIEKYFEENLCGTCGMEYNEVNARGHHVRLIDETPCINGTDIHLSLNNNIQLYVYQLLNQYKSAACIVVDLHTNKIIALVSVPSFDANAINTGMNKHDWQKLIVETHQPFTNKAISSLYPPGSIFKLIVAYAALEHGISPYEKVHCVGHYIESTDKFHCWKRKGHGYVDMRAAICESCDCYFYEMSKRVGIENIRNCALRMGFGSSTGIELASESSGFVPSKAWKLQKFNKNWVPYETMLVGIGQGAITCTLSQLTLMMCNIARGTIINNLSLINDTTPVNSDDTLDRNYLNVLRQALFDVCNIPSGTAYRSCNTSYKIAGKTATSQIKKISNVKTWQDYDHAIFVGYAPYINPRYVVSVIVEHGRSGAKIAAPIAKKIFDKLLLPQK